jgi:hypothetical protein
MRNDEEKQIENSDTRQSVKGLTETDQDSYQNLRSLRPHHDIQHDGLHRLVGLIPSPSLPTFCLECHPTHLFVPRDPPKYQPKAGLDDLPAELILQIFQDCDPDDILALIAVSPRCSGVFRNYGAEVIINFIARLRDKISCPTAYTTHDVFDSLRFSPKGRKSSSTPTWHIHHNAYRFGYKDMMGCFPEDAEGPAPNRYLETTNRACKAQVGDQRFCRCDWVASSLPSDLKSLGVLFELADNLQNRNYELPLARAAQVDWHWMSHPRYNVLLYVLGLSDEWYWCTCVCEPDLCTCPMVGPGDSFFIGAVVDNWQDHRGSCRQRCDRHFRFLLQVERLPRQLKALTEFALKNGWKPATAGERGRSNSRSLKEVEKQLRPPAPDYEPPWENHKRT